MIDLLKLLEQRAIDSPFDRVVSGAGESLTAAALLDKIGELSGELLQEHVTMVALYADNCPAWAVIDLACQLNGTRIVPVPTFFSRDQITALLKSAAVDLLIFDTTLTKNLPIAGAVATRDLVCLPGFAAASLPVEKQATAPVGTDKITFTSGSTGDPKGVCLSFSQCLTVAQQLLSAIDVAKPRHLCVLPISTLLENIGGLYLPLLGGGEILIPNPTELGMQGSSRIDAAKFLGALDHFKPETLILVPQLLSVLDGALDRGWKAPDSLRFVAVGGARVAPAQVQRARQKGLPVYEGYGLSECGSVVSLNTPNADRCGTSGKVLPHVQISVNQGELTVSGNTFLGYLGQPDSWGAKSVATGDLGSVDQDGYLTVSGRAKNLIITSFGRNVSPEWIESELLGLGLFQQAVVLGDGLPGCVALLATQCSSLAETAVDAALATLNGRLPDYGQICGWLRLSTPLTSTEGLLTANGRPQRAAIMRRYESQINQLF